MAEEDIIKTILKETPFVKCILRDKDIQLKPEEIVRQLFTHRLIKEYGYPIFFAVSEKGGKDNSGDYAYLKDGNGQYKLGKNGHLIVDHDLHNHGGELPDGIAEAFIEFSKKERLSFW